MIYIFEGIDCAGKSSVIEKLNEKLGYEVIKGSSFEITGNKNESELYEAFNELADKDNVIFDRYIYSNRVYAPRFNDYSNINDYDTMLIEEKIHNNAVLVYLYADKNTIIDRFRSRGEEYVDESQIDDILEGYMNEMLSTPLHTITIDTSHFNVEQAVDVILDFTPESYEF